jgi:2-aminoadipate transaminase
MTVDETRPPSSAHEIERYGGLFAKRTRGMTSSAMRDMMAVTARPEVISLAGGLPDTSTFPPDTFAAVTYANAPSSAATALLSGAAAGLPVTLHGIAEP